jgi:hypothetical protein
MEKLHLNDHLKQACKSGGFCLGFLPLSLFFFKGEQKWLIFTSLI